MQTNENKMEDVLEKSMSDYGYNPDVDSMLFHITLTMYEQSRIIPNLKVLRAYIENDLGATGKVLSVTECRVLVKNMAGSSLGADIEYPETRYFLGGFF